MEEFQIKKRPDKNFKLILRMTENGMSTLELGYIVGCSGGMISMIRNNWKKPSDELARKIEDALSCKDLFD